MRVGAVLSIEHIYPICTELLDLVPISSPSLPTTPSHLHALLEPLGEIGKYNPSSNPYCVHLKDMPRKIDYLIMLLIFLRHWMSLRGH